MHAHSCRQNSDTRKNLFQEVRTGHSYNQIRAESTSSSISGPDLFLGFTPSLVCKGRVKLQLYHFTFHRPHSLSCPTPFCHTCCCSCLFQGTGITSVLECSLRLRLHLHHCLWASSGTDPATCAKPPLLSLSPSVLGSTLTRLHPYRWPTNCKDSTLATIPSLGCSSTPLKPSKQNKTKQTLPCRRCLHITKFSS